ncbi:MAG: HemK family protein methyltransferase [Thermaerobacter sp.]|nr:HemK family protein methyltransferase [Thermaerobacter sp.]
MRTLTAAWDAVRRQLARAGVPDPERETPLLLAAALGLPKEVLYRDRPPVDDAAWVRLEAWTERRARREPMAYVLGRQEFFGLELVVTPRVLVPRPATETLVATALAEIPARAGRVVDVGVGSGAVALALARHGFAGWQVEGVDSDLQALTLAKINRERVGVRARFYPSDLLAQVEGGLLAVVANLPYVGQGDAVDPEVHFEPPRAVFGGARGPELILRLVGQLMGKLAPDGHALLEVGAGQAVEVAQALAEAGLTVAPPVADVDGIARVVWGRR